MRIEPSMPHLKVAALGPVKAKLALVLATGSVGLVVIVGAATAGFDAADCTPIKTATSAMKEPSSTRAERLVDFAGFIVSSSNAVDCRWRCVWHLRAERPKSPRPSMHRGQLAAT